MCANCTATEVRDIIDTGLDDTALGRLIVLADGEMTARGLTGTGWTTEMRKTVSMLLTAEKAAMNDVRSSGKGGYQGEEERKTGTLAEGYRAAAERMISELTETKPHARLG